MGLDSYLSAKFYISTGRVDIFDEYILDLMNKIHSIFGINGNEYEDYYAENVTFQIAYWRNSATIHEWFVHNVQYDNANNDSEEWVVTKEHMKKLLFICENSLKKHILAKELYPYCGESLLLFIDNFSFEYDEYPIITEKELVYTSLRLKRILNEKAFDHAIFYYSSGW